MSVKTATKRVTRAMRAAFAETISPANQGSKIPARSVPFTESVKVSREFGQELHQRLHAYTGAIDEVGSLGSTADSWRLEFRERSSRFDPANGSMMNQKRRQA